MTDSLNKELEKKGEVIWFFGRPCAGKTTLAKSVENRLIDRSIKTISFDGDELRKGLNKDLGFSITDRKENIRRAAELANLFASKGYCVVCSFVTPTEEIRNMVKSIIKNSPLFMIFVNAPLNICISRDVKGYYKLAKEGDLSDFTGINSPFEKPINADVTVNTEKLSLTEATEKCLVIIH